MGVPLFPSSSAFLMLSLDWLSISCSAFLDFSLALNPFKVVHDMTHLFTI
jgi:hypothetical protein